jgi:three-Cys-motif partner protein
VQDADEYRGREQSHLKHQVLYQYLLGWGLKLGSAARNGPRRLCYIDGFAGPWKSESAKLDDTSIVIGLRALEAAAKVWRDRGAQVVVEAAFVEKDGTAFTALDAYLKEHTGTVRTFAYHGEFETYVPRLQKWMGDDAALIFVDPTGWKGAAMRFIAPLVDGRPRRDVLINVMFDHINRFKDDPREFLRTQMRDFFGLGNEELADGLDEESLFSLYRMKLKELCRMPYAADLAIPHPTAARTKFRLVIGGSDPAVLELFRNVEKKVVGEEAAGVRDTARAQQGEARTGQLRLLPTPHAVDPHYESLHARGLREAPEAVLAHVRLAGSDKFAAVWPQVLEGHHVTKSEVADIAWKLGKAGQLFVENPEPRQRTARDETVLRATT